MSANGKPKKAKAVGNNHVALELDNTAEASTFYGNFLDFEIERMRETAAFIYFCDQLLTFSKGRNQISDGQRHFGIAVDNKELARSTLGGMGIEFLGGRFFDFLDPWGNWVEITTYTNIQYTKADHLPKGMDLSHLKNRRRLGRVKKEKHGPLKPLHTPPILPAGVK